MTSGLNSNIRSKTKTNITDLIPCSNILLVTVNVNTLGNVRRLLLQRHKNIAGLVVKACARDNSSLRHQRKKEQTKHRNAQSRHTTQHTFRGVIISNLADGVTNNFLVVHCGMRGYLTSQQDHSSLGNSLYKSQER